MKEIKSMPQKRKGKYIRNLTFISLIITLFLLTGYVYSNNVTVSNISITDQNTTDKYVMVKFDITWDNSWRVSTGPANWDAAWVFVKFRVGSGEWSHALLNDAGHTAPSGSTITNGFLYPGTAFDDTTNPGIGVLIYRDSDGSGTFSLTNVKLRWNYGVNGVDDYATVSIQVHAIEMVYVTQSSFYVGDGTTSGPVQTLSAHNTTSPFQITGEGALTLGGTTPGNLGNRNNTGAVYPDDFNDATTKTLPAEFPKGYNAFYCMKYELTQQGYVDFLNTLNRTQQNTRTATDLSVGITSVTNRYVMSNTATMSFRNGIRCDATIDANAPITFYNDFNGNGIGNESGDGQKIAGNWLSWADVRAYLDWCGLRPMTELEYEKACRGPNTAVANEYAWGTTSKTNHSGLSNSGLSTETASNGTANCANTTVISLRYPLRVGSFAKSSSTRTQAGATYYGIMDMTGNLWERHVTIGNATGRLFTGIHGNGMLNSSGDADVLYWPGTDAIGSGQRGGDFRLNTTWLRLSDRGSASETFAGRLERIGIRGLRTAQ